MPASADQHNLFSEGYPMMDGVRSYLLSVIAVAIICGLLPELLRESGTKTLVKTACGLVLTVTVFKPLGNISIAFSDDFPDFQSNAAFAAAEGEDLARAAVTEVIKIQSEAYILDKAAQLGEEIQVEIELALEPPYVPVSVRITGDTSREARRELEALLVAQFQIPKEAQLWTP